MSGRFKAIGGVLAATGIVLGTVAITTPAYAGSSSDCPTEYVCAWTQMYFEGTMHKDIDESYNWNNGIENEDESWANHGVGSTAYVRIFTKQGYEGDSWCLAPGDGWYYNSEFDHRGSSHAWVDGC